MILKTSYNPIQVFHSNFYKFIKGKPKSIQDMGIKALRKVYTVVVQFEKDHFDIGKDFDDFRIKHKEDQDAIQKEAKRIKEERDKKMAEEIAVEMSKDELVNIKDLCDDFNIDDLDSVDQQGNRFKSTSSLIFFDILKEDISKSLKE